MGKERTKYRRTERGGKEVFILGMYKWNLTRQVKITDDGIKVKLLRTKYLQENITVQR